MRLLDIACSLLLAVSAAQAQKLATYKEETSAVTYKIGFPEAAAAPFDIFLSVEAPVTAQWVGVAFGGCMLHSPILLAWPNGKGGVTLSSRWAQ